MEPLSLDDILDKNVMAVGLPGSTKADAIDALSRKLLDAGYITEIPGFEKDIFYRETLGKTGIGNYVAIPHGQSSYVKRNGIAIGKFKNEIPWESIDEKGVYVVCLFSVQDGDNGGNEHLRMLAALATKLGKDKVINALLAAGTVDEMVQAFDL
jgi:PTS system fructose-specific IIA component